MYSFILCLNAPQLFKDYTGYPVTRVQCSKNIFGTSKYVKRFYEVL